MRQEEDGTCGVGEGRKSRRQEGKRGSGGERREGRRGVEAGLGRQMGGGGSA